jgi:hypothetical protein
LYCELINSLAETNFDSIETSEKNAAGQGNRKLILFVVSLYGFSNISFPLTTNDFLILSQNETQNYI